MQFTRDTWLEMVRDAGRRHGLAQEAAALRTDPCNGTIAAPKGRLLAGLLARHDEPRLSATLAAERVLQGTAVLEHALGRTTAPVDLQFVRLLGPAGAARFLAARKDAPAGLTSDVVGRAGVRANPGMFTAPGRGGLSLAQVHANAERMLAERRVADAGLTRKQAIGARTDAVELAMADVR